MINATPLPAGHRLQSQRGTSARRHSTALLLAALLCSLYFLYQHTSVTQAVREIEANALQRIHDNPNILAQFGSPLVVGDWYIEGVKTLPKTQTHQTTLAFMVSGSKNDGFIRVRATPGHDRWHISDLEVSTNSA